MVAPENIPQELAERRQWVVWRYVRREGDPKPTKVLHNVRTGGQAQSTNPQTWGTLEQALAAAPRFDGIGFVVSDADPYCGIDVDDCLDEQGTLTPRGADIVARLGSYTEITPSGSGIRVWVRAHLPAGHRCKKVDPVGGNVEIYDTARFFTVTGARLAGTPAEIADRQEEVEALYGVLFPEQRAPRPATPPAPGGSSLSDLDVLSRMLQSQDGAKIGRLLQGDLSDYGGDHSGADLALANFLAYWCRGDEAQMDRLFRQSRLMREKWDSRRGQTTYGQITLGLALEGRGPGDFYTPPGPELTIRRRDTAPTAGPSGEGDVPESSVDLVCQPLTDLGNAERIIARHGDDLRYVPPWKSWLVWNGTVWVRDCETAERGAQFGSAYRMAAQVIREMKDQMQRAAPKGDDTDSIKKAWRSHGKSSEGHGKLNAALEAAARYRAVALDELDAHNHLLTVRNGTIDLRNGNLIPPSRDHLLTKALPVAYDPDTTCPTWDHFMRTIFSGVEGLDEWMWRVLGYTLTGEIAERIIFILWGNGRNGKSTLLEAFADLMGPHAGYVDSKVIMARRFDDGAPHEVAQLPGKRFVYTGETSEGCRLHEARVKALSGGDTIQACAKYEHPFVFRPRFKLFLATNHKPDIRGSDQAIWDRVRLVEFGQRFYMPGEEPREGDMPADKSLPGALRNELPGALARCVRAAMAYYKEGLPVHEAVTAATSSYREDSDVLGAFLAEVCEVGEGLECKAAELWGTWQAWCEKSGEYPRTQRAFGLMLRERGFEPFDRGRTNKANWRGLRVIPQEQRHGEHSDGDGQEPGYWG